MRHVRYGGNVLHLEALGAGRLHENGLRVGPHQRFDSAADLRIEIGGLDIHAPQIALAEGAGWTVGGIRHQQVIARVQRTHQRQRDGGKAGGRKHRAGGASKFAPCVLERLRCRSALGAICEASVGAPEVSRCGGENCRTTIDRRVHEAELLFGPPSGVDEFRLLPQTLAAFLIKFGHFAYFLFRSTCLSGKVLRLSPVVKRANMAQESLRPGAGFLKNKQFQFSFAKQQCRLQPNNRSGT